MKSALAMNLQMLRGEETKAAQQAYANVPSSMRASLVAFAMALIQEHERASGSLVVVADLPAEHRAKVLRDLGRA